ncbi:hypothetical protein EYF80_043976 [Liparis tanakae]|uniref:Uncharacterized protein n=1 Tax=Liparis tanakae TaxID=230148 RepID=A0A4Z2FXV8_9TELE|nr:hypothetical protein EYF80_043976 [Liparis tanakae]
MGRAVLLGGNSRYGAADRGVRLYSSLPMRPNPDGKRLPSTGDLETMWTSYTASSYQEPREPGQESTQPVCPEPRSVTLGPMSNKRSVTLRHQLELKEVFKGPILYSNIIARASKSLD